MAHQKMYTPAQLLAILTNMDDCESDGGDEAPCTLDDSSDASSEDTSSEDTCGTSDEENRSPPAKKRKADKTPAPRAKAKDGTKSPFSAPEGPTEHAKTPSLRHRLLQEKAMSKMQRPLPAPGKKTQCQVQSRCNRNHSTEQCAACGKYTCRKCRKEGPWLCSKC
ncbi:hypothetical protein SRHO_G00176760 [Serrasalmus rhombeus]